jgi:hypothetical protein
MTSEELRKYLTKMGASRAFSDLCEDLLGIVPDDIDFDSDKWNAIAWLKRPGNHQKWILDFSVILDPVLRVVAKLWVLHGRLTRHLGHAAAQLRINAFIALSHATKDRTFRALKSDDFHRAERWLSAHYGEGTVFRAAGTLQHLARWLTVTFGWRLQFENKLRNPLVHGRYGTEEGREAKLIPTEVLRDLVAANTREGLSAKDEFFLAALTIAIATGFRIVELATMPADCLLHQNGALSIRYFPEKGGRPAPRLIHPAMAAAVEAAVKKLIAATATGRTLAKTLPAKSALDWSRVVRDEDAFRYFTAKWAHDWTGAPEHLLINPNGAWLNCKKRFIDAISAFQATGGNKSLAARNLGIDRATFYDLLEVQKAAVQGKLPSVRNCKNRGKPRRSWDTDTRVISIMQLELHISIALKQKIRDVVRDIIDEARASQLKGRQYHGPTLNRNLEDKYRHRDRALVRHSDGKPILLAEHALFVIPKHAFSERRGTKAKDFHVLTDRDFSHWLSGEKRARGSGNHEDSVLRRLDIRDPRTSDVASFTWHSIRHWLDTAYENGGLTADQIALIFGRKGTLQNSTYDQTSNRTRIERVAAGIRDNTIVGRKADTYHRLAKYSREDAEDYLAAGLRMVNPMPHGDCTLDWSRASCPHHLSCFSSEGEAPGPCEDLIVDPNVPAQVQEVETIHRQATLTIAMMEKQGGSRQVDHYERVRQNTRVVLDRIKKRKIAQR